MPRGDLVRALLLLATVGCLALGQTQLVLYSQGLALVEEERAFLLEEEGVLELRGFPRETLWESLSVEGVEVKALRPREVRGWSLEELLGQEITVQTGTLAFRGILRAILPEGLVLETPEGVKVVREYLWISGPKFAEPFPTQALLFYRAQEVGMKTLRFRYLARGLSWKVVYDADFSEGILRLQGKAVLQNSTGRDFSDVKIVLVAGEIYGAEPELGVRAMALAPASAPAFEYHRYDLPGRWDLPQGTVALPLISAEFPATQVFRLSGEKVETLVQFVAPEILPAGEARVYAEGIFVGADTISHTAKGEEVELRLGMAFDLKAQRVVVKREKLGENLFLETRRILISSSKERRVTVEVVEDLPGYWRILSATLSYEILDAQRVKFAIPVEASGKAELEYTVEWRY